MALTDNELMKQKVRELSQDEGLRDHEIAALIGVSRKTVHGIRKENNIPTANLQNRNDKSYTCHRCQGDFTVRRKERRPLYCDDCKRLINADIEIGHQYQRKTL